MNTTRDPRRSFTVNGAAYAREANRKPEPTVSFPQAALAGIMLACFVAGVLLIAVGLS
jgi:hypothetical protein